MQPPLNRKTLLVFFVFISALIPGSVQAALILKPGTLKASSTLPIPTAYWTFDGQDMSTSQAFDRGSSGIAGTLTSGPLKVSGKRGQGLRFKGNGSGGNYVDMGSPAALRPANITLSAWVKIEQSTGADQGIISSEHGAFGGGCTDQGNGGYILWWRNSTQKMDFRIYNGPCTWVVAESNSALTYGMWYHVAATYDGSTAKLYIDGALQSTTGSGSAISYPSSVAQNFSIGKYNINAYATAIIDDVRLHDSVLTAGQIYSLYMFGRERAQLSIAKAPPSVGTPVAHWTFDTGKVVGTTAIDSGSSGLSASLVGAARSAGKLGQALAFNGINSVASVSDNAVFSGKSALSISFWFYANAWGTNSGLVTKPGTGDNSTYEFQIGKYGSSIKFNIYNATACSSGCEAVYATVPSAGVWHHLVATYDDASDTMLVYIDGVQVAQNTSANGGINNTSSALEFAAENGVSGGRLFNGKLDDIRIYDGVLTAIQVSSLYTGGTTARVQLQTTRTPSLVSGLVGYWTFDGKDTGIGYAVDKSSQRRDLTLSDTKPMSGKMGQALYFNGTASNAVTASIDNSFMSSGFSVAAWFKTDGDTTVGTIFRSTASDPANQDVGFDVSWTSNVGGESNRNKLAFGARTASSWTNQFAVGTSNVNDSRWHLGVGTFDGTTFRVYVDGVLEGSRVPDNPFVTSTAPWSIGRYGPSIAEPFRGQIDDVRVYNRALSAAEIRDLYTAGQ